MKKVFKEVNCTTSFVPSGCTGFVQVLDMAINKPLKDRIKELSEIHYDNNIEQWEHCKYSIGDRRIMITKWVGQTWRELHSKQSHVIVKAFQRLGLTLAIDGSEDEELYVKDIPDIQVGDWTCAEEILLNKVTNEGERVVPEAAIPFDSLVDSMYCMDYEDEAMEHDSELDAETEDNKQWW